MHAPKLLVAVSLATLLAACSKPKPRADEALARDLDLALSTGTRGVVSPAELGALPHAKPHAPAAQSHARPVPRQARPTLPAITEPAPAPEPAQAKPQATEETVAVAPAPEPMVVTQQAPAAEPEPSAEPQPTHGGGPGGGYPGGGGGGWSVPGGNEGGFRIPGIGGVVIIRGGGSGLDPCDEHHRPRGNSGMGGMGGMGGGILINPRAPSLPGRTGGGWSGGRFGR